MQAPVAAQAKSPPQQHHIPVATKEVSHVGEVDETKVEPPPSSPAVRPPASVVIEKTHVPQPPLEIQVTS